MSHAACYAGPWPTEMPTHTNGSPVSVRLMAWASHGARHHTGPDPWPWGCAEPAWWEPQGTPMGEGIEAGKAAAGGER